MLHGHTTICGGAFLASAVLLAPAFGVAGVLAARIIGNIMKTSIVMLAAARTKEPGHER